MTHAALTGLSLLSFVACTTTAVAQAPTSRPMQFIYFGIERNRIHERPFLDEPAIAGAQLRYLWPQLEPERDRYDLSPILADLAFLEQHGKRLWIQVQDVSFYDTLINVPGYLLADTAFHGGVARQYGEGENGVREPEGWVSRRWDPAVRARFFKLIDTLAAALDGRIVGINFPETSIGVIHGNPDGYSPDAYASGIRDIMTAAGRAFRRSAVIQWDPLESTCRHASLSIL